MCLPLGPCLIYVLICKVVIAWMMDWCAQTYISKHLQVLTFQGSITLHAFTISVHSLFGPSRLSLHVTANTFCRGRLIKDLHRSPLNEPEGDRRARRWRRDGDGWKKRRKGGQREARRCVAGRCAQVSWVSGETRRRQQKAERKKTHRNICPRFNRNPFLNIISMNVRRSCTGNPPLLILSEHSPSSWFLSHTPNTHTHSRHTAPLSRTLLPKAVRKIKVGKCVWWNTPFS